LARDDQNTLGLSEIHALLGRGTEFEGKLTFKGRVRIDGHFKGDIKSDGLLIVGDEGSIEGDVEVATLIVRGGRLNGTVRATELVELHSPGKVEGRLEAPHIFIDRGVTFDGTCKMSDGAKVHPMDSDSKRDGPARTSERTETPTPKDTPKARRPEESESST
jgi:cytoskeletal protein CcmA (bactofilin family)